VTSGRLLASAQHRAAIIHQDDLPEELSGRNCHVHLGFALVLALIFRQAAVPASPAPAVPATAEVGFDLRSTGLDTPAWPALLAGIAGFGGDFIGR
jgi:hypothetical protein